MAEEREKKLSFSSIRRKRASPPQEGGKGARAALTADPSTTTIEVPKSSAKTAPNKSVETQGRSDWFANATHPHHNSSVSGHSSRKEEDEEFDVTEYIGVLLRRKYWLLSITAMVIVTAALLRAILPVSFTSMARLLVISASEEIGEIDESQDYKQVSPNRLLTHLENLRSPSQDMVDRINEDLESDFTPAQVGGMYSVTREREADIIRVQVVNRDSQFCASLANAVAAAYEAFDLALKQRSYTENENWIEQHLSQKRDELRALEKQLKDFKEAHPTFTYAQNRSSSEVIELEKRLRDLTVEIEELGQRERLLRFALQHEDSQIVQEVTYDRPLEKELLSLELELARMKAEYGEDHRRVITTIDRRKSIEELISKNMTGTANTTVMAKNPRYSELVSEIQNLKATQAVLGTRKSEMEKSLESAYRASAGEPELELRFNRMQREMASTEKIHNMLQAKLEETRLKKSAVKREVILLSRAAVPNNPIPHKLKLSLGLSLLLGLGLGVLTCFMVEFFDRSIKTPLDVEKQVGLAVLGVIPGVDVHNRVLKQGSESKLLEPYRSLRTNLTYTNHGGKPYKTLLIASALQGEGKTTKAVNLAISFALDGRKVLVVDADLRRAGVHHHFGLTRERGFSDYLTGQLELKDILKRTQFHGLQVVTAGAKPPNPPEILGSQYFNRFLEEVDADFDIIIFDSPAILPVSDALVIAPRISAGVIVYRTNMTPVKAGTEILRQLRQVGANIVGGILNAVPSEARSYYYYGYYGYAYYQTYYEEGERESKNPLWEDIKETFHLRNFPALDRASKSMGAQMKGWQDGRKRRSSGGLVPVEGQTIAPPESAEAEARRKLWHRAVNGLLWLAGAVLLASMGYWAIQYHLSKKEHPEFIPKEQPKEEGGLSSAGYPAAEEKVTLTTQDSIAIRQQAQQWLEGLGSLNFPRYMSTYSKENFRFSGGGFEEWKKRKLAELSDVDSLHIRREAFRLLELPTGVETRFIQAMDVGGKNTRYLKIQRWQKENGGWFIVQEGVQSLQRELGAHP